jgi:hypothetical protein
MEAQWKMVRSSTAAAAAVRNPDRVARRDPAA